MKVYVKHLQAGESLELDVDTEELKVREDGKGCVEIKDGSRLRALINTNSGVVAFSEGMLRVPSPSPSPTPSPPQRPDGPPPGPPG